MPCKIYISGLAGLGLYLWSGAVQMCRFTSIYINTQTHNNTCCVSVFLDIDMYIRTSLPGLQQNLHLWRGSQSQDPSLSGV